MNIWNAIGVFANCADIFKMTPTDEGMCCSFNMPAAEEIYINSEYTRIIAELQNISRGKHLQPGGGGGGVANDSVVNNLYIL